MLFADLNAGTLFGTDPPVDDTVRFINMMEMNDHFSELFLSISWYFNGNVRVDLRFFVSLRYPSKS